MIILCCITKQLERCAWNWPSPHIYALYTYTPYALHPTPTLKAQMCLESVYGTLHTPRYPTYPYTLMCSKDAGVLTQTHTQTHTITLTALERGTCSK